MSEYSKLNIFQKMSAITDEINKVAKNLNVGYGKSSYKAVGEADILSAVKPIEIKYGIYSYPVSRQVIETNVLINVTTSKDEKGNEVKNEKSQLFMRLETTYRFVNVDNPTEYIDLTSYGDGVDTQDKACGKAMTYSDKYALMKAYKIETGDDPDQYASLGLSRTKETPKQTPKTTNKSSDTISFKTRFSIKCGERNLDKSKIAKAYKISAETKESDYETLLAILERGDMDKYTKEESGELKA